jgi:Cdc6-like AAA superfamily ATPase
MKMKMKIKFKEENMVLKKIESTLIERQVSFTDSTHYNIYGDIII